MARKKTASTLIDLAGDIIGGKGVDTGDLVDLVTGTSSSKKKRSDSSGNLISKLLGDNGYPQMSAKSYWAVRAKFQRSIPEKLTNSNLASSLNVSTTTVKNSIMPSLLSMGLVNSAGTVSSKAKTWADDQKYEAACKDIFEDVYPSTVRRMSADNKTEQRSITSWFKKNADVTQTAAEKMLAVYLLLRYPSLDESASNSESSTSSRSTSSTANSLTVKKSSGKAVISIKLTVDDNITKTELTEKFDSLCDKAYEKL